MVVPPSTCCDRDCEKANGEKLTIAMTAPNVVMADRRLTVRVSRASGVGMSECFTIFLHPSVTVAGNATPWWWFYDFVSSALEVFSKLRSQSKRSRGTSCESLH